MAGCSAASDARPGFSSRSPYADTPAPITSSPAPTSIAWWKASTEARRDASICSDGGLPLGGFSGENVEWVLQDEQLGSGGVLAALELKKGRGDGHEYMLGDVGILAINPAVFRKLAYDAGVSAPQLVLLRFLMGISGALLVASQGIAIATIALSALPDTERALY